MAATRVGPPAAAAAALARLHPGAAPALQPLLDRQSKGKQAQAAPQAGRKPGASGNRFVRQQALPRLAAQGAASRAAGAAVQALPPAPLHAGDIIDLTDSPRHGAAPSCAAAAQRAAATAKPAQLAQRRQADAPWFLQWPSKQRAGEQPGKQASQVKQGEPSSGQREHDLHKLWPAEWPSKSIPGAVPAGAGAGRRAGSTPPTVQHPAPLGQQQEPGRRQQREEKQRLSAAGPNLPASTAGIAPRSAASARPELDIDALWPASWPARRPAGKAMGSSSPVGDSPIGSLPAQRRPSREGSRAGSPEPAARLLLGQKAPQRRTMSRSRSPEPLARQRGWPSVAAAAASKAASVAGPPRPAGSAAFVIPKRQARGAAGASAAAPADRAPAGAPGAHAAASTAAPQQAQQAQRQTSLTRSGSAPMEPLQLLDDDDSLFAGLPLTGNNGNNQASLRPVPPPRQAAGPAQPARRIVHLAAPPTAALGGRCGAGQPAVPLWQQRRAALGQQRQLAAAAAALLTMDQLLQQLLSWEPSAILSGRGATALQGLKVPVRFVHLQQYTQVRGACPLVSQHYAGRGRGGVGAWGCREEGVRCGAGGRRVADNGMHGWRVLVAGSTAWLVFAALGVAGVPCILPSMGRFPAPPLSRASRVVGRTGRACSACALPAGLQPVAAGRGAGSPAAGGRGEPGGGHAVPERRRRQLA